MKILFICTLMSAFFLVNAPGNAYAQTKKKKNIVRTPAREHGVYPGFKTPLLDEVKKKTTFRGSCYVYLDNYTGYFCDVWINGYYQGRLSPYATSNRFDVWTPGNEKGTWYMQSVGGTYNWRDTFYCDGASRLTNIVLR